MTAKTLDQLREEMHAAHAAYHEAIRTNTGTVYDHDELRRDMWNATDLYVEARDYPISYERYHR